MHQEITSAKDDRTNRMEHCCIDCASTGNCSIPTKNHRQMPNSEHYRNIWKICCELSNEKPKFEIIPLVFSVFLELLPTHVPRIHDPKRKMSSYVLVWRNIKCFITMYDDSLSSSFIGKIPTNKRFEKTHTSLLTGTKSKPDKSPSFVDCVGPKRSGNKLSSQSFSVHLGTQPI